MIELKIKKKSKKNMLIISKMDTVGFIMLALYFLNSKFQMSSMEEVGFEASVRCLAFRDFIKYLLPIRNNKFMLLLIFIIISF